MRCRQCAILAGAAAIAMLTGCHRDQKAIGHGTVSGEILKGSVSDDMLPYDSVKSKAPLAPPLAPGPADRAVGDAGADSTDATAAPQPTAADSASSPVAVLPQN